MPVYTSMLRGINVGPHKRMKMDRLRASFEALGLEHVQTYIQSGNVVFRTGEISTSRLSKQIEERLLADFNFSVPVVTRTAKEMSDAVDNNPFLKEKGIDLEKLHVMFLSDSPPPAALKQFTELITLPDRLYRICKELFFYLPNGVSGSILMKQPVERLLQVVPTMRNWRTVNQLAQMCKDCK
ncbi:MAG: DUF1697 domain-containing protein [Candidatus Sulfotelmatobacter sp.]